MLFPQYLNARASARRLVKEAINYLVSVTPTSTGNLPAATDEVDARHGRSAPSDELVHWCHGASGAVYAYARAYVLWKDEVYLREAARCADVAWGGGLLKKGPGICHGVAGSGYTQLALYRITGEERYLDRARACAAFMDEETFLRG
uniref:LanC-like protein 3 n=1 Tax=Mesocestoides corti TaxID=53468 RepID=A0A5K3ELF5_MESCO